MVRLWLVLGIGWMFDAMDVGLLSFALPVLQRQFVLSDVKAGLLGSATLLGMLVGAVAAGRWAERYGRIRVLQGALLWFGLGSLASACAPGYCFLLVARLLTGLGLGAELPVAAAYMSEQAPASTRGRWVVALESFWAVGWVAAALIGSYIVPVYGWRWAFGLGALPAAFAVVFRLLLPHTLRARAIPVQTPPMTEGSARFSWHALTWIGLVWFLLNFSYYGVFVWLPSFMTRRGFVEIKSFRYVLVMALAQLPGYALAAWAVERWGRRVTLFVLLTGSACAAWGYAQAHSVAWLVTCGCLLSLCNLGAWGALYAYTPEWFVHHRAAHTGAASAIGRVGALVAPALTGWLVPVVGIYGAVLMHACALGLAAGVVLLRHPPVHPSEGAHL